MEKLSNIQESNEAKVQVASGYLANERLTPTDNINLCEDDGSLLCTEALDLQTIDVEKGKHLAQRSVSQWIHYGDPNVWDREFERAVLDAVDLINARRLILPNIIKHFEKKRSKIEHKRNHGFFKDFGSRRTNSKATHCTLIKTTSKAYGYSLERALKIPFDIKYFLDLQSKAGKQWVDNVFPAKLYKTQFRYGLVQGFIGSKPIPLTQYIFSPREHSRKMEIEQWFGGSESNYIGDKKESGIMIHTGVEQIPRTLKHIEQLINKALDGDLTIIPRIHWWYVHVSPDCRGSGGVAEMITNTLCRLNNVDLPAWADGVAPSIEVLLEPDEKKFCSNYHKLFKNKQAELQQHFNTKQLNSKTKSICTII